MQIVRSERRESVLLLALIGVAAGCIVHGSLKPPSENGEQWLDLRSKHFHLMTDLDAEEAEGVVRSFEQGYARLGRVVFGSEAVPDFETEVIAFRSEGEFREFRPAPLSGQYLGQLPNDQEPTPTMLIYGGLSPENSILFTHELTHRFNHFALPAIPVWLNEGIAQYYSTVRGDVDHPVVGETDPRYGFASGSVRADPNHIVFQGELLAFADLPRPSALMRFDRATFYGDRLDNDQPPSFESKEKFKRNYAAAWVLVHMLMTDPLGAPLASALQDHHQNSTLADALRALDARATDVDRAFDQYVRKPIPWREHHESPAPAVGHLDKRAMSEAEVLVLWARIDNFRGPNAARAFARLQRAAALAPDDPAVLLWTARHEALLGRPREAERHLQRALGLEPSQAEAQLALGMLYLGNKTGSTWPAAERDKLMADAFERLGKIAATATEYDAVAIYHLIKTGVAQAVGPAAKACELDPSCWSCLHTYAAATFRTGDRERAAALELAAVSRLPENASETVIRTLTRDLERYRAAPDAAGDKKAGTMLFWPD